LHYWAPNASACLEMCIVGYRHQERGERELNVAQYPLVDFFQLCHADALNQRSLPVPGALATRQPSRGIESGVNWNKRTGSLRIQDEGKQQAAEMKSPGALVGTPFLPGRNYFPTLPITI
jgi:hypothetical protein